MEYKTSRPLSAISQKHYDFVTQDDLSPAEAVSFLLKGMQPRNFRDIVRRVCGSDDQEQFLIEQLCRQDPTAKPDSIRRKVKNWYNGKSLPSNREDVFSICFALNLDQLESNEMLRLLTEQGIHYRDSKELIYAYCLRYGLGYAYACHLVGTWLPGTKTSDTSDEMMSVFVKKSFPGIQAEEDLFSFLMHNRDTMGTKHNTAYAYFSKMLKLLSGEDLNGEAQYSLESVAEIYLRMNVPEDKKTGNYSDIQKIVKKYWPGARSIKAMKSRGEEVTRKTLLLLYLVTGGVWDGEYDELDEAYIPPREFLETHCKRMNDMLEKCGFCRIDPRNAFDFLVLYCLRPEDELFMSDRMAALAAELFNT